MREHFDKTIGKLLKTVVVQPVHNPRLRWRPPALGPTNLVTAISTEFWAGLRPSLTVTIGIGDHTGLEAPVVKAALREYFMEYLRKGEKITCWLDVYRKRAQISLLTAPTLQADPFDLIGAAVNKEAIQAIQLLQNEIKAIKLARAQLRP